MKLLITALVCCLIVISVANAGTSRLRNKILKKYNSHADRWNKNAQQCGYESCHATKDGMLNVHIVPHTHDDVGWLKTVDEYYYGSHTRIQKAGVQYILDSVVQELLTDPDKRFIYAESAFFFKWWDEQSDLIKQQVRKLVNEGRLEFIGGAWTMNDEAGVHYQSTIDQFTWGLRQLNDTFGSCGRPRLGWQIDPFGHSREMASMLAQMGYDGLFFGRIDYQDKTARMLNKTMEFVWHGSSSLGDSSDLFSGMMYNQYQAPSGFCWDILCSDEPIIDGKDSPYNNVEKRVDDFIKVAEKMSESYKSNNILVTMGEDFHFQVAHMWYKNLDKLIKYTNARQASGSKINLLYSTPSCYLKSLHEANITWTTKTDDFFPYSSDPHAFWTGYFTSRPNSKRFERVGNHFLQVCKQLSVFGTSKEPKFEPGLTQLREAMGIMQHHDAITGTEKQHVSDDYHRILDEAIRACERNTQNALKLLTNGQNSVKNTDFDFENCHQLNISHCHVSENSDNFIVTIYNPLAHSDYQYARIPVRDTLYYIRDYRGVPVSFQTVPIPDSVRNLHYRVSNASYELVFLAEEIPPLGFKSYFVARGTPPKENDIEIDVMMMMMADEPIVEEKSDPITDDIPITIGNKYINITFDPNGHLAEVFSNGVGGRLNQEFYYYEGAVGNNEIFVNRSSGAYIFRPNSTAKVIREKLLVQVFRGPVVDEVHQIFNDWLSQVVRVYKDENYAEFEWLVGPIPIDDGFGKEIITRFYTDIKSNGTFETDSNGRETLYRIRNHRPTWTLDLHEPIAGNYYPVNAKIAIEDDNARLAVLNDRSQGGSSLLDGTIELMLHRRLLRDDAFGVEEALNETAYGKGIIARGQTYLLFGTPSHSVSPSLKAQERFVQQKKLLPSWIFFSDASKFDFESWQEIYTNIFSGVALSLPRNVHLLTLEPWKDGDVLIRFEHLMEPNEDDEYAQEVTFNLKDVLHNFDVTAVRETTLAANQWLNEATRMKFHYEKDPKPAAFAQKMTTINDDDDPFVVVLEPMQIRTFVLSLEWKPDSKEDF